MPRHTILCIVLDQTQVQIQVLLYCDLKAAGVQHIYTDGTLFLGEELEIFDE